MLKRTVHSLVKQAIRTDGATLVNLDIIRDENGCWCGVATALRQNVIYLYLVTCPDKKVRLEFWSEYSGHNYKSAWRNLKNHEDVYL